MIELVLALHHNTSLLGLIFYCYFTVVTSCRSTTPQQWEDFSRYNKERAEAEMKSSTRLREAIHHTLQQTANDLEAQKIATEYAYRRRIHEFERAKDELEWQKKNVCRNILFLESCLNGQDFYIN